MPITAVKTSKAQQEGKDESPQPSFAPHRHFRIGVQRLDLGMFVAELDRPWVDTPFLLQGFIVDTAIELATLRKYCQHVYVDLDLSHPEVADKIREAENLTAFELQDEKKDFRAFAHRVTGEADRAAAGGKGAPLPDLTRYKGRDVRRPSSKVSVSTRARFREFIRHSSGSESRADELLSPLHLLLASLGNLFKPPRNQVRARNAAKLARQSVQREMLERLPAGTKLRRYQETRSVEQELPRARAQMARSVDILEEVVRDVRSGAIPEVQRVEAAVDDMVESIIDNPDALMWIARLRDENTNTYAHGVKVSLYMISLGRHLGFPKDQLAHLGMIGMLCDVGKIRLPRALLEKPGMLTPEEHAQVQAHVQLGLEALGQGGRLADEVRLGIAEHHERMDGTGYPRGMSGDRISIYGRIAGIADCFAALITSRAYADAASPQDALMNLYQWSGTSFHEALVEQFVQSVGVFPVGSLIELNSGEVALVVAQNRVRRLEPKVLLLTWPDKRPLAHPVERDLFRNGRDSAGKQLRIARGLPAGAYGLKSRDYYADSIAHANRLV